MKTWSLTQNMRIISILNQTSQCAANSFQKTHTCKLSQIMYFLHNILRLRRDNELSTYWTDAYSLPTKPSTALNSPKRKEVSLINRDQQQSNKLIQDEGRHNQTIQYITKHQHAHPTQKFKENPRNSNYSNNPEIQKSLQQKIHAHKKKTGSFKISQMPKKQKNQVESISWSWWFWLLPKQPLHQRKRRNLAGNLIARQRVRGGELSRSETRNLGSKQEWMRLRGTVEQDEKHELDETD